MIHCPECASRHVDRKDGRFCCQRCKYTFDSDRGLVRVADMVSLPKAFSHEARRAILLQFGRHDELSPVTLAKRLDIKLSTVSYHVRVLVSQKVLKETKRRKVRGAVEHFYAVNWAMIGG